MLGSHGRRRVRIVNRPLLCIFVFIPDWGQVIGRIRRAVRGRITARLSIASAVGRTAAVSGGLALCLALALRERFAISYGLRFIRSNCSGLALGDGNGLALANCP